MWASKTKLLPCTSLQLRFPRIRSVVVDEQRSLVRRPVGASCQGCLQRHQAINSRGIRNTLATLPSMGSLHDQNHFRADRRSQLTLPGSASENCCCCQGASAMSDGGCMTSWAQMVRGAPCCRWPETPGPLQHPGPGFAPHPGA